MQLKLVLLLLICFPTLNLSAQDWPNLAKFEEANAQLKKPKKNENRVVFMGNSITEGWANTMPAFFEENPYINRGISGQTTPQMLVRFRQDVVDLQPKAVVILAGINDIAGNTGPSSLEMIIDNIQSMAEIAQANDIKVIISSVLPAYDFPWRPGMEPAPKVVKLNKMLKKYSKKQGFVYLDYFTPMADKRNALKAGLGDDGVHPNLEGYQIMAPLAKAAIAEALK
ncbi:MAG TPA: SGNH/GDSL hydrolase family protein [Saprospiraceae bacterium]|nr:SGNH/GDSL hydrolase family protein [Saprospiraceae bacterium]